MRRQRVGTGSEVSSASTDSTTTTVVETTTIAPCEPDTRGKQVDIVVPGESIQRIELPEVTVSDVEIGQQDLSFRVDRVGVPVLVKVSYFPNWQVEGAEGPYRVAPNFMVVIPTDNEVRLEYGRSGSDTVFYGATVVGLGLLVWFRRRGDVDLDATAIDPMTTCDRPTATGRPSMPVDHHDRGRCRLTAPSMTPGRHGRRRRVRTTGVERVPTGRPPEPDDRRDPHPEEPPTAIRPRTVRPHR